MLYSSPFVAKGNMSPADFWVKRRDEVELGKKGKKTFRIIETVFWFCLVLQGAAPLSPS